jgi:O-antigen/teichoic acid export membrane protein
VEVAAREPIAQPLTQGSRLARNVVFNLLGQGLPLLAAFFAIPRLIEALGTDRFGVLTLAWMVIGYFSLFDLGLSRALTQMVATKVSEGASSKAPAVVWPALGLMLVLGLLGTVLVSGFASPLVHFGLKVPVPLQSETVRAFYLLAAAIPIVVLTSGLVGILAAFQRFGVLNGIRAPLGIFTFIAPLVVLPFSRSLVAVTAALVLGRLLAFVAHVVASRRLMPSVRSGLVLHRSDIRTLFRLGAWMTVSNIIGPMMLYMDRFVIGAMLSVAAVAYYATPYEMITRLLIVPAAILGVLFPAIAANYRQDHARMVRLFTRGTKYTALILFPVALVIITFAHEGLGWWVGADFARNSAPVLQWLALGVFLNSLAQLFATLVQGIGRPDLTAKLHVFELPIYLVVLWFAIREFGILGAAMAWTCRVALDGALLFWLSRGFLGDNRTLSRQMIVGILAALACLALPLILTSAVARAWMLLLILTAFVPIMWFMVLGESERVVIRDSLGAP